MLKNDKYLYFFCDTPCHPEKPHVITERSEGSPDRSTVPSRRSLEVLGMTYLVNYNLFHNKENLVKPCVRNQYLSSLLK